MRAMFMNKPANKGTFLPWHQDRWTALDRDPQITKALAAFGRAGVPLYLAYNSNSGGAAPVVLPQLLTATVVRDAFSNSPNRVLK